MTTPRTCAHPGCCISLGRNTKGDICAYHFAVRQQATSRGRKTCAEPGCDLLISGRGKTGMCAVHVPPRARLSNRPARRARQCLCCGAPVGESCKTGLCKGCASAARQERERRDGRGPKPAQVQQAPVKPFGCGGYGQDESVVKYRSRMAVADAAHGALLRAESRVHSAGRAGV